MRIVRLISREISHRRLNAVLMVVSVSAAVGCLIASVCLMRGHDLTTRVVIDRLQSQTNQVVTEKEEQTRDRVKQLKDDYRKIVLTLGFNVFILPKDVKPDQAHLAGIGGHEMPESYVTKLANSDIITVDHLLPSLSSAVLWTEKKAQVILTGVRGEVSIAGKKRKRPLIQPVNPGEIVLGYLLAEHLTLKPGDEVAFLGKPLKVSKVHAARGTQDDNTVWVDLRLAQDLLGKDGKITAIQAINCLAPNCHPDATGIPSVTQEITGVLPDTQVIIDMGKAKARIEARHRAAKEASAALDHEKSKRADLMAVVTNTRSEVRQRISRFASLLIPLMIAGAVLWVSLLMLNNVRERRAEIGVLRAIGMKTGGIFSIFLGKAFLVGCLGGVLGVGLGIAVGVNLPQGNTGNDLAGSEAFAVSVPPAMGDLIDPALVLITVVAAPLLAMLASWIPAMLAAQQDPARVLCEE